MKQELGGVVSRIYEIRKLLNQADRCFIQLSNGYVLFLKAQDDNLERLWDAMNQVSHLAHEAKDEVESIINRRKR